MASDNLHVGQLICDSTTPPPDRGFYKINDTTTGHVGQIVCNDPVTNKASQVVTATANGDGVIRTSAGGVEIPLLAASARPPEHFHDDIVVITATAPVKCGGGVLKTVSCVVGAAITLTIKDSPHDSTGRTIYTATLSAGDVAYPNEVAINGMYASFTGTATFELTMGEVL